MLHSLMTGNGFLNLPTRQVPVLYISEEADNVLSDRADAIGYDPSWPIGWLTREPGMTWEKCIFYMKRWVYLYRDPLIIVDTLARFWNAGDENNATQVDHALNPVLEIIRNSQASFFGIHHNRKQGGGSGMAVRGSTALTGGVDIIMELQRLGPYDRSPVRRIQCESRFSETPQLLQVRLNGHEYEVEDAEIIELEPRVVSMLQTMEQVTVADMSFMFESVSETTLRRLLTGLTQRGVIHRSGTGTNNSPYRYSLAVASES